MRLIQDITLGQYYPGSSCIHSLDPRTKILSLLLLIVSVFNADNFILLFFLLSFVLFVIRLSSFSLTFLCKGMGVFLWLFTFTATFHIFFSYGDSIYPFPILGINVTSQGLSRGSLVFMQLFSVILLANIFTLTTEPGLMAYGLERMLKPLKKIGFRTEEISLMIILVIRFIPILKAEVNKLINAQKGRGIDVSTLPLMKKLKNNAALIGPLFTNIFTKSDALVLAMISRGFGCEKKRSRMKEIAFKFDDILALFIVSLFFLFMVL